jgi:hypothetical protein
MVKVGPLFLLTVGLCTIAACHHRGPAASRLHGYGKDCRKNDSSTGKNACDRDYDDVVKEAKAQHEGMVLHKSGSDHIMITRKSVGDFKIDLVNIDTDRNCPDNPFDPTKISFPFTADDSAGTGHAKFDTGKLGAGAQAGCHYWMIITDLSRVNGAKTDPHIFVDY